jgi:chemotaxis protein methyltransferase CheR
MTTTAKSNTVHMSSDQFDRLREIIYTRSGISFQPAKKYILESRLGRRLSELEIDNYDDYITFLTIGPYRDDEFQEMFNRITINETSFFRNNPQLEVFERVALPKLLEAKSSSKRLRLWSAACSSGEEPYTLAMMIHRTLGIRFADWRIEILGTDISQKVLDMASEGVYSNYAMRSTSPTVLNKYFRQEGQSYVLDPTIQQMVTFEKHNLKDRLGAKRHGIFDVIFCRNVMIYFDEEMKKGVVKLFEEMLDPNGWLFIGHSETLRGISTAFEGQPYPEGFCYRKPGAAD